MSETRFPSPFEVPTPEGCEGWENLYPYYYLFSEDRREFEESKFWFFDGMHHPEVLYPFDTITSESWWVALGEMNSRVFVMPPALGIDQRVLNGRLYISANAIMDDRGRADGYFLGHYCRSLHHRAVSRCAVLHHPDPGLATRRSRPVCTRHGHGHAAAADRNIGR